MSDERWWLFRLGPSYGWSWTNDPETAKNARAAGWEAVEVQSVAPNVTAARDRAEAK